MEFIDLKAQQAHIRANIEQKIGTVLDHGRYIMGPEIAELEERLAEFVGTRHALACSSGTDALMIALMALEIGPGDAVLTTPFTFIATAEVINRLGAVPVFVDIDPLSFNISPRDLPRCLAALTRKDPKVHPLPNAAFEKSIEPKAIIAVDLFGLPAAYDEINAIAGDHRLKVIEDAAQSLGGQYKGRQAGSLADIGCTSFFPSKPLGCYGDGGMCFTDSDIYHQTMNSLREHGKASHRYDHHLIGLNGRMDTIQAAILLAKFEIFPEEIAARQQVAQTYSDLLLAEDSIQSPQIGDVSMSVWAQYSVLAENEAKRRIMLDKLDSAGIPKAVYYPKPLHLQTAFTALGYQEGDFPVSENTAKRIFSLPMHPYLSPQQQQLIVAQIT